MAVGTTLLTIDGTYGEGGGALLRTAIVMSAMTQQPLKVVNVRGGTRFPGLDPEDLTVIKALEASCGADLSGAEIGSEQFSFLPNTRAKGLSGKIESFRGENGRGSNALVVLNTLLPVMARAGVYSSVSLEGETHGTNSLSYDAFANVTLEAVRATGLHAYPALIAAGFGRESRGEVELDVEPCSLHGIDWSERGTVREVRGIITTCHLPQNVADRALSHFRSLSKHAGIKMELEHLDVEGHSPGCYVTATCYYEKGVGAGTAFGARGVRVETLVQSSFEEMLLWMQTDASFDPFLADQMLLPCVFAEGPSRFKVSKLTQRFLTSVWVVKQFTPIHITIRGSENHPGSISISR